MPVMESDKKPVSKTEPKKETKQTLRLLLCIGCKDIFRVFETERKCKCGAISGTMSDGRVLYTGGEKCIPITFDGTSLTKAICGDSETRDGYEFKCYVAPVNTKDFQSL